MSWMRLPREIERFLSAVGLFGNSSLEWLTAALVAALTVTLLLLLRAWAIRRLAPLAARTSTGLDDLIFQLAKATRTLPAWIFAVHLGSLSLDLPPRLELLLKTATVLALLLQASAWAAVIVDFSISRYRAKRLDTDAAAVTLIGALGFIAKLIAWAILVLLALDNLGVNVTALVAGLGVGGIAVALALQRVLGDVLAALSIVTDKPFVIGDNIQVGDLSGTVKNVGLRSTRLQSTNGEELIFANSDLLQSRIRNFKLMEERRNLLALGVSFATPIDRLEEIPGLIREAVERHGDRVRFDRAHLIRFGAYSFDFEAVYFVLTRDYIPYADIQQQVHLDLLRAFAERGIELATNVLLPKREAAAGPSSDLAPGSGGRHEPQ
jgi:small-conductance mechanosensitive channel